MALTIMIALKRVSIKDIESTEILSLKGGGRMNRSISKYYLASYSNIGGLPDLIGYADETEREEAFIHYIKTGEIEVWQYTGSFTIKPKLILKMNASDSAMFEPLQ